MRFMNINLAGFISGLFLMLLCLPAKSQLVNGCAFLQQNRVEIGIANNGAYGTPENAPAGYHPNNQPLFATMFNPANNTYLQRPQAIGFVADYDSNGWSVGTPPYIGDYFLPGTPQEGWAIEVNGVRVDAFTSNYQTNGTTGFTGGTITGSNQFVSTAAGVTTSVWSGTYGNLQIKQTTKVKQDKLYFIGNVKLYNTGGTPLNNVYYMRTLDPDNDVAVTNNFTTINDITYQLPNAGNKSLVGCTSTVNANAYLGLGTIDCRSKVFICDFGLFPPTDTLGYLFSGTHPDLTYTGSMTQDVGVGIVYNIGTIAPGDSAELNFAYILSENQLDEALDAIKPKWMNNSNLYQHNDTIYACPFTAVPVSIINGDQLTWTWNAPVPLSNPTGLSNTVFFGNSTIQVTAVGTGICNDTIIFYLSPTDTIYTTINAGICSGNAYVFNGVSYTVGGVYHDTVSTSAGCDSIVTLNLNVGANSTHTINASICSGATYFFNGNTLSTSGTYYDTLVNAIGCDSLIILNLLAGGTTYGSFNASICQGQTYPFNGNLLSAPGAYLDTIPNVVGCDSIITLNLSIKPLPVVSFTASRSQLCSDQSVTLNYTGSMDPNNIHTLNTDGGIIQSGSGAGPYVIRWNTPGTKTITWSVNLNGCAGIPATQTVEVILVPQIKLTADSSICIDGVALAQVNTNVPGNTYNWNLGTANLISGSTATGGPLTLSWATTGIKWIYVQTDNMGCLSNLDSARIQVNELPTADIQTSDGSVIYCETDLVKLACYPIIPNAYYQWSPMQYFVRYDFNEADLVLYDTTLITVNVTTANGCATSDTLTLFTKDCDDYFIPNVFSPNGDQVNDVFRVIGLRPNAHVEMMIYDRWGKQLFQSYEKDLGWNGSYKGTPCDAGVYFYYVKITFGTGETKIVKGDITLIR